MDTINVTRADQGEHWLVGTDVTTIKASGQDTSGYLLVMDVTAPPGGGPPVLHRHPFAETFRFLQGEFEVSTVDADLDTLSTVSATAGAPSPSRLWYGTTSRT